MGSTISLLRLAGIFLQFWSIVEILCLTAQSKIHILSGMLLGLHGSARKILVVVGLVLLKRELCAASLVWR